MQSILRKIIRKEGGITLIALVITIVVLLILAGITINLLFSNGGIFDIANQAKIEHEIGALKDRINNVIADWTIERAVDSSITVDILWDKMVKADIITDPETDVAGPEKEGENDVYQVTTNEGYVVEVIVSPDGNVSIGEVVKGDKIPPKIVNVETTSGTNNIQVTVTMSRWENGTISYYYKKDGEEDTSYKTFKENVTELTANIEGLEQNVVYNIKIVAENENGRTEKVVKKTTGEIGGATGGLTEGNIIASSPSWSNGQASITLSTSTGLTIQYQINGIVDESWKTGTSVTGLNHNDTVYARLTDGTNYGDEASVRIQDKTAPRAATISLSGTSVSTEESITATVTLKDNESGVNVGASKWVYNTISGNIGINESSYTNTFSSNGQKITLTATAEGTYYLHVLTVDKAGNKKETVSSKITVEKTTIAENESYIGYYADIDGNGTVDGVIYADLAFSKSGQWGNSNGAYSYTAKTGLKNYYVSQTSYAGLFGTKDVLAPVKNTQGTDRFYVMALTDIDGQQNETKYCWYAGAYGNMSDYATATSTNFGTGKANTEAMISKWKSSSYGAQNTGTYSDMWGIIQSKVSQGWFVPSRDEWGAFADNLGITESNHTNKGLSYYYWSSSPDSTGSAWNTLLDRDYMLHDNVLNYCYVRLSATF